MHWNAKDLAGLRFGRLTVLSEVGRTGSGGVRWLCACDCGNRVTVASTKLQSGLRQSCGCLHAERVKESNTRHGHAHTPTWSSWGHMISRCHNPKNSNYRHYGGRGIAVCEAWRNDFLTFLRDMGERPAGKTIDRINNDGNYEPG